MQVIRSLFLLGLLVPVFIMWLFSFSALAAEGDLYSKDGVRLTTPFRFRNEASNQYMIQSNGGNHDGDRAVVVRPGVNLQGSDLWVLEGGGFGSSCIDDKRKGGIATISRGVFSIVNVKTGLVLTQAGNSNTGVVVWGRTPDDPVHSKGQRWEFFSQPGQQHVGQFFNCRTGNGLTQANFGVTPGVRDVQTWPGQEGQIGRTWHLEQAPKADLARITIKSVRAVQTSTGQDSATAALFKSIEFASEYATGIGSGGSSMAVGAGKSLAKLAIKVGTKQLTKLGKTAIKKIAAKLVTRAAQQQAKKISKAHVKAVAKRAANKVIWNTARKTTAKVSLKTLKGIEATFLSGITKIGLTSRNFVHKNIRDRIKDMVKISAGNTRVFGVSVGGKTVLGRAARLGKAEVTQMFAAHVGKKLLKDTLIPFSRSGAASEGETAEAAAKTAADLAALEKATNEELARQIAEAEKDNLLCEAYVPTPDEIANRDRVVTRGNLSRFGEKGKEITKAISEIAENEAAELADLNRSVGGIVADTLLMDSGWLKNALSPLIDNTADDLEIRINGTSVWPNGGRDHRKTVKGATKSVNAEFVFLRQKGIDIQLVEYDSGSDDDDLGHLKFSTSDLTDWETYESAFIVKNSEGSLYEITFVVSPYFQSSIEADRAEDKRIALAKVELERSNRAAIFACARVERFVNEAKEEALRAQRDADMANREAETLTAILKASGKDGVAKYLNTEEWKEDYLKACLSQGRVDKRLGTEFIPGVWRVGKLNARGEKDRSNTWEYTFDRNNWNHEKGHVSGPGFEGLWQAKPYETFNYWEMKNLLPIVKSIEYNSETEKYEEIISRSGDDYCDGISLVHKVDKADLKFYQNGGINYKNYYAEKHSAYLGASNTSWNYAPLFLKANSPPSAYFLNDAGEPVAWMEKVSDEKPIPRGLCGTAADGPNWKNHHDLDTVMAGTWQAEEIRCPNARISTALSQSQPRWTFTKDGAFLAHRGGGADFLYALRRWSDVEEHCEVSVKGTNNARNNFNLEGKLRLERDANGGQGWSFDIRENSNSRPDRCYRVRQVSKDVQYGKMTLAERTYLDSYRDRNIGFPMRSESERADAEAIAATRREFLLSLTEFQKSDACSLIGEKFTQIPLARNDSDEEIHVRNDSEHVWSVYWIDNLGNDRIAHPSGTPIQPVAIVQPGEKKVIKSDDGFVYAIYSDGEKYGSSQCVGAVTTSSRAFYTEKVPERFFGWREVDGPRIHATLFTSSYEKEKVAKAAEDRRTARFNAHQKVIEEDKKRSAREWEELQKQRAEEQRLARIAAAAAEVMRLQRIKDAKGCLDHYFASEKHGKHETHARLVNNRSDKILAYWVNYDGEIDKARPTVTVAPGQAQLLVDSAGAKYQIEDSSGDCLAVVLTDSATHTFTNSGSTSVQSAFNYQLPFAKRPRLTNLIREQIKNGCDLYGQIASRPTNHGWGVAIHNDGATDINVSWVSFYGEDENGRVQRKQGVMKTIASGKSGFFSDLLSGDVLSVSENNGQCVAMVRGEEIRGRSYNFTDRKTLVERKQKEDAAEALRAAEAKRLADERQRLADLEAAKRQEELDRLNREAAAAEERARQLAAAEEAKRQAALAEAKAQREAEEREAKRKQDAINAAHTRRNAEAARQRELAEQARKLGLAKEAEEQRLADEAEVRRLAAEAETRRKVAEAEAARLAEAERRRKILEVQRVADMRAKVNVLNIEYSRAQCGRRGVLEAVDMEGNWDVGPYDGNGSKQQFNASSSVWSFTTNGFLRGVASTGPVTGDWDLFECRISVTGTGLAGGPTLLANVIFQQDGTKEFYILDQRNELFMWGKQGARVISQAETARTNRVAELDQMRGDAACSESRRPVDKAMFGDWNVGPYDERGNKQQPEFLPSRWRLRDSTEVGQFSIDAKVATGNFNTNVSQFGCGYLIFLGNQGRHIINFIRRNNGENEFYVQKEGQLEDSLVLWGTPDRSAEIAAAEEAERQKQREAQARRKREEQFEIDRLARVAEEKRLAADTEIQRQKDAADAKLKANQEEVIRSAEDAAARERAKKRRADRKAEDKGCHLDRQAIVGDYTDTPAKVSITNAGAAKLNVFWVNYSGIDANYANDAMPQAVVGPGQSVDIDAFRGFGFSVKNDIGSCVAIVLARESRNSFSLDALDADGATIGVADTGTAISSGTNGNSGQPADTPVVADVGPAQSTCELRGQLISTADATPVSATASFYNSGTGNLHILWANYHGGEGDYQDTPNPMAVIAPGGSHSLSAYVGYKFVALDDRGACLGVADINNATGEYTFAAQDSAGQPADTPVVADSSPAQSTCELRGQLISTADATPVSATASFYNSGTGNLHILWANYHGGEGDYQDTPNPMTVIAPGGSHSLSAYVGYKFVALDDRGECLGVANINQATGEYAFAAQGSVGQPADNPVVADSSPVASTCQARGQLVSTADAEPVAAMVNFVNTGTGSLNIMWANYQGSEGDYQDTPNPMAVIEPGGSKSLSAYVGYKFVALDDRGECLGVADINQATGEYAFAAQGSVGQPADNPVVADSSPVASTCQARGQLVSTADAEPVAAMVNFVNTGTGSLNIMWANYQGSEGDYQDTTNPMAVIEPGGSQSLSAYVGYKFVAIDDRGECLGVADINQATGEYAFAAQGSIASGEIEEDQEDHAATTGSSNGENSEPVHAPINELTSCDMRGQLVSTSQNEPASVSLTNIGTSYMHVYWIGYTGTEGDYEGAAKPVASVGPGETQSINASIGFAFSAFDEQQNCLGIAQISGASNSFAFQ